MAGKKLTDEALLGERGIALLAGRVLEMGFVWYPTGSLEAGIDGFVEIRDVETKEVLNLQLGVQSKAYGVPFANEPDEGFDYYCSEKDLAYWLRGNLPVVLVVSRPSTDEAYWVSVKDYFASPSARDSRKIHFNKSSDHLTAKNRQRLAEIGLKKSVGLYLTPPSKTEQLLSNLLPVLLPDRIFVAQTNFRLRRHLFRAARDDGASIGAEWILSDKSIIGFQDFRRPEWESLCDRGSVEDFDVSEWAFSADIDREHNFVDLLQRTLQAMFRNELAFREGESLYYFRPTEDLSVKRINYAGLVNASHREVFRPYLTSDGHIKYYRHSAFEGRFMRLGDTWYLAVNPTYFFTRDGFVASGARAGLLSGIKRLERHPAVRGQLIMWASFLTPHGDLFNQDAYPFLMLKKPEVLQIEGGIHDELWDELDSESEDGTDSAGSVTPSVTPAPRRPKGRRRRAQSVR